MRLVVVITIKDSGGSMVMSVVQYDVEGRSFGGGVRRLGTDLFQGSFISHLMMCARESSRIDNKLALDISLNHPDAITGLGSL